MISVAFLNSIERGMHYVRMYIQLAEAEERLKCLERREMWRKWQEWHRGERDRALRYVK